MKKLTLILALGLVLAACAGEPQVVVVTATSVPPTVTPAPPTATPILPTITPVPWDARVSALAGNLREFPHLNSQIMHSLIGGAKVDLLAVSPDNKWVHANTAAVEGSPILEGWLQVDKLVLNVSLDDLTVDAETVFVQPPTRTPGPTGTPRPTELPIEERYIAHFVDLGFEVRDTPGQYENTAGRGNLIVSVIAEGPLMGYVSFRDWTEDEQALTFAHLEEAATFLRPNNGWMYVQVAIQSMSEGMGEGFVHTESGGEIFFRQQFTPDIALVVFTFLPVGYQHTH